MKKCPVCGAELFLVEYEGFKIMKCRECKGHLLPISRLECIKRVDQKSKVELKAEASSDFKASSTQRIKCPHCHMPMRKESIKLPVLDLHADYCNGCSVVWFDGGELALVQLAHEASRQFINAQDLKRRMQELEASPERKARFEENLAKMPDAQDPVEEVFSEVGRTLLEAALRSL